MFETVQGKKIPDVVGYIREHVKNYKDDEFEIFVGCDSQAFKGRIQYATGITIYRKGKGGHVIIEKNTKITKGTYFKGGAGFLFTKLWEEVELAVKAAKEILPIIVEKNIKMVIHVDVNPDEKFKSNSVYKSAIGYLAGMGFDVVTKPTAYNASHVADVFCKY